MKLKTDETVNYTMKSGNTQLAPHSQRRRWILQQRSRDFPRCAVLVASLLLTVGLFSSTSSTVQSFQLGSIFPKAPFAPPSGLGGSGVDRTKSELLDLIRQTNNGKDASAKTQRQVLQLVETLEQTSVPPSKIPQLVNGVWYLDYTQPIDIVDDESDVNSDDVESKTKRSKSKSISKAGQVIFLGVTAVDVSDSGTGVDEKESTTSATATTTTTQTIDVNNQRITNRVTKPPSSFVSTVEVGGTYVIDNNDDAGNSPKFRIVVSFDRGIVEFFGGLAKLDISLLFDLRANLLQKGSKVGGWLDTTYVDETIRIGRGNRGSLFILTRDGVRSMQ